MRTVYNETLLYSPSPPVSPISSPTSSVPTFWTLQLLLILVLLNICLHCSHIYGVLTFHWSMVNFPVSTLFKKSVYTSTNSYQLPIALQLRVVCSSRTLPLFMMRFGLAWKCSGFVCTAFSTKSTYAAVVSVEDDFLVFVYQLCVLIASILFYIGTWVLGRVNKV